MNAVGRYQPPGRIVNFLNAVLSKLVAVGLTPFASYPAIGLFLTGLLAGVVAAVVFRFTSSQSALRRVSDQTRANLLAMRLFSDDPRNTLRAQFGLLAASGKRLLLSLPPMVVMAPLFLVLLAHMAMWYEFRPFKPAANAVNEAALVEARFSEGGWKLAEGAELKLPAGATVSACVRSPRERSITWRLGLTDQEIRGDARLLLADGREVPKALIVTAEETLRFASPRRPSNGLGDRLLYPGEPAFASDSPVQSISIAYPRRVTPILGKDIPWWLTFLVASILGALLAKPLVGVQF